MAVHVLTLLAAAGEEPLKSDGIARSVNTNPVVVRRLLCALARAGLVASQTGAAGGYRLPRPAREVTLREVYRAVEGRGLFAPHRQPPNPRCRVGLNIGGILADVLAATDAAVDQALGGITLEDVSRSVRACARGGRARLSRR